MELELTEVLFKRILKDKLSEWIYPTAIILTSEETINRIANEVWDIIKENNNVR